MLSVTRNEACSGITLRAMTFHVRTESGLIQSYILGILPTGSCPEFLDSRMLELLVIPWFAVKFPLYSGRCCHHHVSIIPIFRDSSFPILCVTLLLFIPLFRPMRVHYCHARYRLEIDYVRRINCLSFLSPSFFIEVSFCIPPSFVS